MVLQYKPKSGGNWKKYQGKEKLKLPIIWGGIHPTFNPHQTLENENIDVVVIDEGDLTFLELIEKFGTNESLKDVLGIGYKENGKDLSTHFIWTSDEKPPE